jgi:hypothetical protein
MAVPERPAEMRLGRLDADARLVADELLLKMPREITVLINERTKIASILKLSEILNKDGRLDDDAMKMAQGLAMTSSSLHFDQLKSTRKREKGERSARRSVEKAILEEELAHTSFVRKSRKPENTELELLDFIDHSGNEGELHKLLTATRVADKFILMKDPGERKNFRSGDAKALYEYLFPNENEREDWNAAILPRIRMLAGLEAEGKLLDEGVGQFHAIVGVSKKDVIGYTQFSTLPLGDNQVVVYWQYGGVADRNFMQSRYKRSENFREEGVGSAFYVFRHGIGEQDARGLGRTGGVVGTILEAEFIGQGENADDIRFTATRLHIHRQAGAKAIIFEMEDGTWLSAHRQPKLSDDTEGIMLNLLFRPLKFDESETRKTTEMDRKLAESLLNSFFDNFLREGFDKNDTEYSRNLILSRLKDAKRILLVPPEEMPDMAGFARNDPVLRAQIERDYGSLEDHEKRIKEALSKPGDAGSRRLGS